MTSLVQNLQLIRSGKDTARPPLRNADVLVIDFEAVIDKLFVRRNFNERFPTVLEHGPRLHGLTPQADDDVGLDRFLS